MGKLSATLRKSATCALWLSVLGCAASAAPAPAPKPLLVPLEAPSVPTPEPEPPEPDSANLPSGEPVPVGILHSLTGTVADAETPLKEVALMAIDELNHSGGVLGRPVEATVMNPASNWPLFAEQARELVGKVRVSAVFGGYTSVSRKAMLPALEELNGLLFYPTEYEGETPSPSVAYTGAVPNQSIGVVVDYLLRASPQLTRWLVLGTDYVLPRVQSKWITQQLTARGVSPQVVTTQFFPFGHVDFADTVKQLSQLGPGQRTAVILLLWQESALALERELAAQPVPLKNLELVAFGLDERLLAQHPGAFRGALVASSYFSVLDNPANAAFSRRWSDRARAARLPPEQLLPNDAMEATYVSVKLWKQAAESARSVEPKLVRAALGDQKLAAPSGYTVRMDPLSHHLHKPYFLARVGAGGHVSVVFRTPDVIAPEPRAP